MKRTKIKRKSKDKRQILQKNCDRLLQELITTLHPNCEVCGKPAICGHHIFPKSTSNRLRYELGNISALCNWCHFSHHNGNPLIFDTILNKRGDEWWSALKEMKKESVHLDVPYYEAHKNRLLHALEGARL